MDTLTILAISQGIGALIEIWRQHAGKPDDWKPTAEDWGDLLILNEKTAEQYKIEAAARLGVPWPAK